MWQKIKCWLGWHKWVFDCVQYCNIVWKYRVNCQECPVRMVVCKHCGKMKKYKKRC